MDEQFKAKLKAAGLDLAEDSVKAIAENAFKAIKVIIEASENKYDDLCLPLLELAEKAVMPLVDKIDGKVD